MKKLFKFSLCFLLACLAILCMVSTKTSLAFASVEEAIDDMPAQEISVENETEIDEETELPPAKITPKRIIVHGNGKVTAAADVAYVTIGVESSNSDLTNAIEDNESVISSIYDYLESAGIEKGSITTKYYSIFQKHGYQASEKFSDYHVSNNIEIKFTDLENLSSHIKAMTNLGANHLGGVVFDCENSSSYYNQALTCALEDAKAKAATLTSDEVSVCAICEECVYSFSPYRVSAEEFNGESIRPGNIEIEAKLKVIFK